MLFARIVRMACLAFAASLATVPSAAEEIETGPVRPLRAGLPPADDFLEAAQYRNMPLSPDGRLLAAIVPINGRANLAFVDLEHKKVVALTMQKNDDVASYAGLGDRVIEVSVADLDQAGGVTHEYDHSLIDVVDRVELRDLHTISRFGAAESIKVLGQDGTDVIIETVDRSPSTFTTANALAYQGRDAYRYDAKTGRKQLLMVESPADVSTFVSDFPGQVRVPLVRGREMRDALDRADKQYEWVVYSDQQHQRLSPENRDDFYRRMDAFLLKYLAPRTATTANSSTPVSPAEGLSAVVR
jgi:hypothetical protein